MLIFYCIFSFFFLSSFFFFFFFFFFSSRRRHTRWNCDWSSDVCSSDLRFVEAVVLGTILLGIAITDARHYLIPDEYNWTGLVLGLGLSLTAGVPGFIEGVLGAATGFALLYAVGLVGGWVFKEEAMGGGDIKMMAMVGAFV